MKILGAVMLNARPLKKGIIPFVLLGAVLFLVGVFLIVQSILGNFLPHDIEAIGMTAEQLSYYKNGKIVKFMFHDRVSFGGSLITVGILYIWLALVPLKNQEPWAWWVLLFSGVYGFGSFLSYLGHGYLDMWHAWGTLALIPFFIVGLYFSYSKKKTVRIRSLFKKHKNFDMRSRLGRGHALLLINAASLFMGGMVIMVVGMTFVFVPEDLSYMSIKVCGFQDINPNLIPVIAHDRASFGGGLATIGIMLYFITWYARPSKVLWEILAISVTIGYMAAILVHFSIGYLDFWHLFPAFVGLGIFVLGIAYVEPVWSKNGIDYR